MPIEQINITWQNNIVTEELSILDSMKSAFHIWKKYFLKIFVIGLIVYIPTQICIELVSILIAGIKFLEKNQNNYYNLIRDIIGSIALLGIINFTIRILENEEEQTVKDIVLHGLKKWPKYVGLLVIAGFKILGYTILLIIPGVYKFIKLSFLDCIVATDNNDGNGSDELDSLDESEQLVKNRWWKVFSFVLLMFIFRLLFELLFLVLLILIPEFTLRTFLIGVIVQVFGTYFFVVRAVYYLKIKKLKENIINEETTEIINSEKANGI